MTVILAPVIAPQPDPLFDDEVLRATAFWIRELATSWRDEIPVQIHSNDVDAGGAPEFTPAFAAYIERDCRKPDCYDVHCRHGQDRPNPRKRSHKAMRKLRRAAPREFDALYLIVAHGMTMKSVAHAMTERSLRLGKPERYDEAGVMVLVVSAIDKVQRWWA